MIELTNLTKIFNLSGDEKDRRVALDHINLRINDGEFVTIIGSNGSGKTTTMNLVAGTYKPTEGEISLSGMPISQMKEFQRAKYFGRVFQDPRMGTTGEMSVLENLEIAYRRGKKHSAIRWGFSNEVVKEYFISQVKQFDLGLEDRMNQKVGRMSGGQRQALTLLMAANDSRIDTRKEFIKMNFDVASGKLNIELREAKRNLQKTLLNNSKKITELKAEKSNNAAIDAIKKESSEAKKAFKVLKKQNKIEVNNLKKECINKSGKFYDEAKADYLSKINKNSTLEEKLNALVDLSNKLHDYNGDRKILLLDEHTAALDPKTTKKVLELTNKIVRTKKLTTLMITHNMKDALTYGDRLIMFHHGRILHDFSGKEKEKLTVDDLLKMFQEAGD